MKRLMSIIFLVALTMSLIGISPASAEQSGDYLYSISNGGAQIAGYTGTGGSVTIPNILGGYPVIEISKNAFLNKTSITDITIPDTVSIIGYAAFAGCYNLDTINFPNSVTTIGDWAFADCYGFLSITLPSNVVSIGYNSFSSCVQLKSIVIENGLHSIGSNAFYRCVSLESITIPNSVTSIGSYAFSTCQSLATVILPNSITEIAASTFAGCEKLTSITIPNSVIAINRGAFFYCTSLSTVNLPSNMTEIGEMAFEGCSNLKSAYFYGNVPTMGIDVFTGCASEFTVFYLADKTGFTSPTWYGYPTMIFTDIIHYEVTYNANGATSGTVPIDSSSYISGDSVNIKPNLGISGIFNDGLYKVGYKFICWNTLADGTGTDYNFGSKLAVGTAGVNLYAKWQIDYTPFYDWKQTDSRWGNYAINNTSSLMKDYGCAVTSIAMLVVKSGLRNESNFDPRTLCEFLNNNEGFTITTENPIPDNIKFDKEMVPGFQYFDQIPLSGTQEQKLATIRNYFDKGLYIVINAPGHFLAVRNVNDSGVVMMDPLNSKTDLFATYEASGLTRLILYSAPYPSNICKVLFDSQGGSEVPFITTTCNSLISPPVSPVRPGYKFVGWYTAPASSGYWWSFSSDKVTDTMNLFARWIETPVKGLETKSSGFDKVSLSWSSGDGANGYQIFRSTRLNDSYINVITTSSTSFIDSGLITGTTYFYKVRSYSEGFFGIVNSDFSETSSATPLPDVPMGFTVTRPNSTSILVNWSSVDGSTGYEVYRASTLSGKYSKVTTSTSLLFLDTKLKSGAVYYYKVHAYRLVGKKKIYGEFTASMAP